MEYTKDTHLNIQNIDIETAASLVSRGFGRSNDEANYEDTEKHLGLADFVQVMHHDERMIAFAAYKRQLWRKCH